MSMWTQMNKLYNIPFYLNESERFTRLLYIKRISEESIMGFQPAKQLNNLTENYMSIILRII